MNLIELAHSNPSLYNTDKGDADHAFDKKTYLDHYDRFLTPLRHAPGNVMEIGVSWGGSLRLWRDYFSQGQVIGIDNREHVLQFQRQDERLRVEIVDQADSETLKEAAIRHGPYKLIVDDGSHKGRDIISSFLALWPLVQPGGFYVIEDLGMSQSWGCYREFVSPLFDALCNGLDRQKGDVAGIYRFAMLVFIEKAISNPPQATS